jgi:hypothetical protein
MKVIDSKERVFCQGGSRALQQETRLRWTQAELPVSSGSVLIPASFVFRTTGADSTRDRIGCSWNIGPGVGRGH